MIEQVLRLDRSIAKQFSDTQITSQYNSALILRHFIDFNAGSNTISESHRAVTVGDMLRIAFQVHLSPFQFLFLYSYLFYL